MKPIDILNDHDLKRTSCREGIIEVLMNSNKALSELEIKKRLAGNYDRTTFYRSFKALEEHKILHKIVIDNQLVKYALDNSITLKDGHVHFFCNECHTVKCMDDVPIQEYQLPVGYSDIETEVIIKGICSTCKKQGTSDKA